MGIMGNFTLPYTQNTQRQAKARNFLRKFMEKHALFFKVTKD